MVEFITQAPFLPRFNQNIEAAQNRRFRQAQMEREQTEADYRTRMRRQAEALDTATREAVGDYLSGTESAPATPTPSPTPNLAPPSERREAEPGLGGPSLGALPGASPLRTLPGPRSSQAPSPQPSIAPTTAASPTATTQAAPSFAAPRPTGLRRVMASRLARVPGGGQLALQMTAKDLEHQQNVMQKTFELAATNPQAAKAYAEANNMPIPAGLEGLISHTGIAQAVARGFKQIDDMYPGEQNARRRWEAKKVFLSGMDEQLAQSGGLTPVQAATGVPLNFSGMPEPVDKAQYAPYPITLQGPDGQTRIGVFDPNKPADQMITDTGMSGVGRYGPRSGAVSNRYQAVRTMGPSGEPVWGVLDKTTGQITATDQGVGVTTPQNRYVQVPIKNANGQDVWGMLDKSTGEISETDQPIGVRTPRVPTGPTLAQQANNTEKMTARLQLMSPQVLAGMLPNETLRQFIVRATQKQTETGRENPSYDPFIDRAYRAATQRLVGDDPGYDEFLGMLDLTADQIRARQGGGRVAPTPSPAEAPAVPIEGGRVDPSRLQRGRLYTLPDGTQARFDGVGFVPEPTSSPAPVPGPAPAQTPPQIYDDGQVRGTFTGQYEGGKPVYATPEGRRFVVEQTMAVAPRPTTQRGPDGRDYPVVSSQAEYDALNPGDTYYHAAKQQFLRKGQ